MKSIYLIKVTMPRLSKQQIIDGIKELRKQHGSGDGRISKIGSRKRMFYHLELPTLARLAIIEGGANPREVYAKHKRLRHRVGKQPGFTLSEVDFKGSPDMSEEEYSSHISEGEHQNVAYVNAKNVPTSKSVVDCLTLAKSIVPAAHDVNQLSVVLSKKNKVTKGGSTYNGSMACTVKGNEDSHSFNSEKKHIRMVPMFVNTNDAHNMGSLGGEIGNELKESESGGAMDAADTADIFNHHHFNADMDVDELMSDIVMNPHEMLLRSGSVITKESPFFDVSLASNVYGIGDLHLHRTMSKGHMLLGEEGTDSPLTGPLSSSIWSKIGSGIQTGLSIAKTIGSVASIFV